MAVTAGLDVQRDGVQMATGSAIWHLKLRPSTDLWVCVHGVAYPELCGDCLQTSAKEDASDGG